MNSIQDFLDKHNTFAVVGVSRNTEKYGYRVFMDLSRAGYRVYPVNPKIDKLDNNIRCYHSLKELPVRPDVVITVVPPKVTETIVKEAAELGIDKIWMQPGSESEKVAEYCKDKNIRFIQGTCIMTVR